MKVDKHIDTVQELETYLLKELDYISQSLNGKLPHLKDVSNKAYKILKEIHKPKF